MTLSNWIKANPQAEVAKYGQSKCPLILSYKVTDSEYRKLWHLSDYVVSSVVSGPAVVLVPRNHTAK